MVSCGLVGPKYSLNELRAIYYNPFSNDPLIVEAAAKGNVEHIKSLLHYDPTEKEIVGAFFVAIEKGHLDAVKFILKKKPIVKNYTINDRNPVLYASSSDNEIFNYLLDHIGTDQETINKLFRSTFSEENILDSLIGKGYRPTDIWDYDSYPNLFRLYSKNIIDTSKLSQDKLNRILCSPNICNVEMTIAALDNGADPNYTFIYAGRDYSVLAYAVEKNYDKVVKILLDKGANPNYAIRHNDSGREETILELTIPQIEDMKLLLDKGANVNYVFDSSGWKYTPLAKAVDIGNIEAVRLLLDNGADLHYTSTNEKYNDEPFSIMSIAIKRIGHHGDNIVNLLKNEGACLSVEIYNYHTSLSVGNYDVRKYGSEFICQNNPALSTKDKDNEIYFDER